MNEKQSKLLELLAKYSPNSSQQSQVQAVFVDFIGSEPDCCDRSTSFGHMTGSAWLLSKDGQRALLMHHRKLDRWLQPGGHADGDADLAQVALREAEEETGLAGLVVEPSIFDLDRHRIPARGMEPEHWHYDVRFVVRATGNEQFIQNEESLALAWFDIVTLAENAALDESIRRMARKWINR